MESRKVFCKSRAGNQGENLARDRQGIKQCDQQRTGRDQGACLCRDGQVIKLHLTKDGQRIKKCVGRKLQEYQEACFLRNAGNQGVCFVRDRWGSNECVCQGTRPGIKACL
jgi:hypothetical protein